MRRSNFRGPITYFFLTIGVMALSVSLGQSLPSAAGISEARSASVVSALVNRTRVAAGLSPLEVDPQVQRVATEHARAMADAGSLFHSPDLASRIRSIRPIWIRLGQNVGVGQTVNAVQTALLRSPDHRANILGDFTNMGNGAAEGEDGRIFVAQIFVSR